MARFATELASRVSRALISKSTRSLPTRSWTPSLEQTLYKLGCRESLSPSLVAQVIDPHLLNHPSLAFGFFNWATQQPGFAHTSLTYQSILTSLSLSRQFNHIESLLKLAKARNLGLDSTTYGLLIGSLVQGRKTHMAFLVFNEVISKGLELEPEVCNFLLAALGSGGYFDYGLKVFDEMIKRGVGFNTIGLGVFTWRFCCKTGELRKVLSMIDEAKECGNAMVNGSIIAVLIVHGLSQSSRCEKALWVLNELRMRQCKPDFIAYRIVAEAFRLLGSADVVHKVLKMKRKLGVAPRCTDYSEFILGLLKERWICEANELAMVIVDGNFPIDDDVLNALIGSVSSVDPCSALVFFNFVIEKGRVPELLSLSNLSSNLCKHGKIDELLEVYNVLSSNDYFYDFERYNVMFSFLCKARRVREAYDILQEMKRKGLGTHISMYNSLMEACCREDLLRPAKKLWDEMFVTGCGVNLKSYNILIGKFSEMAEADEALRLFNHMLEKGVTPDAITYASLLEGLCQEGKVEAAIEVFNKSVNQKVLLARSILSTFILNLCAKGQFLTASKLLCSLSYDIGHRDSHVVLLKCLGDAQEVGIAVEHVKHIRDTSPSILQDIFKELLALLSSSSEPQFILNLLQAMPEQCIDLNNSPWKQICSNSFIWS